MVGPTKSDIGIALSQSRRDYLKELAVKGKKKIKKVIVKENK